MATRWAICAAGKIAKDFCIVLNSLPATEHRIVAVATANDPGRAAQFAKDYNIPQSFGSYEELAALQEVDIVYVSCIQLYHVETCKLFLQAGKNVLCEKVVTMSLDGFHQVMNLAKEKQVFFMEGYWTRFFPVYRHLREQIKAGVLGDIKHVDSSFCVSNIDSDRLARWRLGGGAIFDVGCYTLMVAGLFFEGKPKLTVQGQSSSEGINIGGQILLQFPGGGTASAHYSCETADGNSSLTVRGTKGNAVIPDKMWCPTTLYINGEKKEFPFPHIKQAAESNYCHAEGFTYEIQCVRQCLLKGLKECPDYTHDQMERQAWMLQQTIDQLGVKCDFP